MVPVAANGDGRKIFITRIAGSSLPWVTDVIWYIWRNSDRVTSSSRSPTECLNRGLDVCTARDKKGKEEKERRRTGRTGRIIEKGEENDKK